jgi:hypothetical protein
MGEVSKLKSIIMKELDLKSWNVQELSKLEKNRTTGGFWGIAAGLFFSYIILEAALNPNAHIKAFKEGWEMAN